MRVPRSQGGCAAVLDGSLTVQPLVAQGAQLLTTCAFLTKDIASKTQLSVFTIPKESVLRIP